MATTTSTWYDSVCSCGYGYTWQSLKAAKTAALNHLGTRHTNPEFYSGKHEVAVLEIIHKRTELIQGYEEIGTNPERWTIGSCRSLERKLNVCWSRPQGSECTDDDGLLHMQATTSLLSRTFI